jgi:hypothetical protein
MQEAAMNNTKERGHQDVQDSSMNNKKEQKGMRTLKIRKKLTNRLSEIDGMDIIDGCKIC